MYLLFETIRFKNGIAENLIFHQQRLDYTLMQLRANTSIILADHINLHADKPSMDNKIYKCRIRYDLTGDVHLHFEPYTLRNIQTVSLQDMGTNEYPFKYADRTWLKEIVNNAGTDDVILTQNGYLKDASYANLVFFDGKNWITPSQPLLMGTRRAALLKEGIIIEASIQIKDLNNFVEFKLINAMTLWKESPSFTLDLINNIP
jgi:4-amino-4-deoxychorismate lyase